MKNILNGKTALITGAESGIGKSIAILFAKNGANIILSYFNNEIDIKNLLSEIKKANRIAHAIKTDIRDPEKVDELFAFGKKQLGIIDIVVNSAGIRSADKPLFQMSFDEFQNTISTNLFGAFLVCKNFVKQLEGTCISGRIINISSIHEEIVSAGKTDYCASKFALKGFSKALSLELAPIGITVNCIAPGMILTPMNQRAMDDAAYRHKLEERIPLGYAANPEEVAKVALMLASDDSAYITGSSITIDGGLSLNRTAGAK